MEAWVLSLLHKPLLEDALHNHRPPQGLRGALGLSGLRVGLAHTCLRTHVKQAHFLASFLLSILFLFLEFSFRQAPPSSHTSRQASLGLLASGLQLLSMVRLLPPAWGSAQGSDGGHSHSQEWDDCREGLPQEQRKSQRKQQPFFFIPLGELITG